MIFHVSELPYRGAVLLPIFCRRCYRHSRRRQCQCRHRCENRRRCYGVWSTQFLEPMLLSSAVLHLSCHMAFIACHQD